MLCAGSQAERRRRQRLARRLEVSPRPNPRLHERLKLNVLDMASAGACAVSRCLRIRSATLADSNHRYGQASSRSQARLQTRASPGQPPMGQGRRKSQLSSLRFARFLLALEQLSGKATDHGRSVGTGMAWVDATARFKRSRRDRMTEFGACRRNDGSRNWFARLRQASKSS